MGNTYSSFGTFLGSVIGGIILGPFTGGANIGVISAITGASIGATGAVISGVKNNHGTNKDLLIGIGGGIFGSMCASASKFGTDSSYYIDSQYIGIGYIGSNNTDYKPTLFIETPDVLKKRRELIYENELFNKIKNEETKLLKLNPLIIIIKQSKKIVNIYNIPNIYKEKRYIVINKTHKLYNAMSCLYLKCAKYFYKPRRGKSLHTKIFEIFVHYVNVLSCIADITETDVHMIERANKYLDENLHNITLLLSISIMDFIKIEKRLTYSEDKVKKLNDQIINLNSTNIIINDYLCDLINNINFNKT